MIIVNEVTKDITLKYLSLDACYVIRKPVIPSLVKPNTFRKGVDRKISLEKLIKSDSKR